MREPAKIITAAPELGDRSPLQVAQLWPHDARLLMLHSGRIHKCWARWSILASPSATWQFNGRSRWIATPRSALPIKLRQVNFTHDPLVDLDVIVNATTIARSMETGGASTGGLPFMGGWIGCFSYDLGRCIEPRAQHSPYSQQATSRWPLVELAWCPQALVFDHVNSQWWRVGEPEWIDSLLLARSADAADDQYALGDLTAASEPRHYRSLVSRTRQYVAAGDVFQANIAQRFSADFHGSTRSLMLDAMRQSQPWYGAHFELADDARARSVIVSLSPELFLQVDATTQHVVTRPIKGTRPATTSSGGGAKELFDSAKDAAELHMIVDLMRNDLGRVCEFGSVEVINARTIETHPTVHHGVGEVAGTLRSDVTLGGLLRATFPGGSVTGAPKIRAMQIIDELEAASRGPYCGAIGFISDCGAVTLNIAIRTMLLRGRAVDDRPCDWVDGTLEYWAGAGIVADSDPALEHQECLDKAAVIRGLPDRAKNPEIVLSA
jgi:para-aminobenzoate synthetase component 1